MGLMGYELGLSHPSFETIAPWGASRHGSPPQYIEVDMLGNYDNPSPYPTGNSIRMLQDLTISFGTVYFNPD